MAREIRIQTHEQYADSVYTYTIDLSLIAQDLGLSISSVLWSTKDSNIDIGSSSYASDITTAPITAISVGIALIKLTISTSGNDAPVMYFKINVLDPES